jgi:hypothetical protein
VLPAPRRASVPWPMPRRATAGRPASPASTWPKQVRPLRIKRVPRARRELTPTLPTPVNACRSMPAPQAPDRRFRVSRGRVHPAWWASIVPAQTPCHKPAWAVRGITTRIRRARVFRSPRVVPGCTKRRRERRPSIACAALAKPVRSAPSMERSRVRNGPIAPWVSPSP